MILSGSDLSNESFNRGSETWSSEDTLLLALKQQTARLWRGPCARDWWVASGCWGFQHYSCKEPDATDSQQSWKTTPGLGWDSSPGWHLDCSLVKLWARDVVKLCLTPDLHGLWDNKCVLFSAIKCVVFVMQHRNKHRCLPVKGKR